MGYLALVITVALIADIIVIIFFAIRIKKHEKKSDEKLSDGGYTCKAADDELFDEADAYHDKKGFMEYDFSRN